MPPNFSTGCGFPEYRTLTFFSMADGGGGGALGLMKEADFSNIGLMKEALFSKIGRTWRWDCALLGLATSGMVVITGTTPYGRPALPVTFPATPAPKSLADEKVAGGAERRSVGLPSSSVRNPTVGNSRLVELILFTFG
jgi:hypothetical protein